MPLMLIADDCRFFASSFSGMTLTALYAASMPSIFRFFFDSHGTLPPYAMADAMLIVFSYCYRLLMISLFSIRHCQPALSLAIFAAIITFADLLVITF